MGVESDEDLWMPYVDLWAFDWEIFASSFMPPPWVGEHMGTDLHALVDDRWSGYDRG